MASSFSTSSKTVFDYKHLIEAVAKREYERLGCEMVSFRQIVRIAALSVQVALLSGVPCNANALAVTMRKAIRQKFEC